MERFRPYTFRNGKTARNRVVVPPMASQTADERGFATERTMAHYARLAGASAGLMFAEYSFVHSSGRGEKNQLAADHEDKIPGLTKISRIMHEAGALAGLQIVHVGGKTTRELSGGSLLGASPVAVPVKGWEPEVPVEADHGDIKNLIDWYVRAALLAQTAGFDFVELHAAHGYGLNQWLSPLTNRRVDSYGGKIENRAQILLETVEHIRSEVPGILLAIRLPAQDHLAGGLSEEDMIEVVVRLERNGADLIDVSSGLGGWRRMDDRTSEGYLVADAALLKAHLGIPVIGVGGIVSGAYIDKILREGKVDFAAVGRAILKDPRAWFLENQLFDGNLSA